MQGHSARAAHNACGTLVSGLRLPTWVPMCTKFVKDLCSVRRTATHPLLEINFNKDTIYQGRGMAWGLEK